MKRHPTELCLRNKSQGACAVVLAANSHTPGAPQQQLVMLGAALVSTRCAAAPEANASVVNASPGSTNDGLAVHIVFEMLGMSTVVPSE